MPKHKETFKKARAVVEKGARKVTGGLTKLRDKDMKVKKGRTSGVRG